MAYLVINTAVS